MDTVRTPPPVNTHAIYEYDLTKKPPTKKLISEYPSIIAARGVMDLLKMVHRRERPVTKGDKMYTKHYTRDIFLKGWAIEEIKTNGKR